MMIVMGKLLKFMQINVYSNAKSQIFIVLVRCRENGTALRHLWRLINRLMIIIMSAVAVCYFYF